VLTLNLNNTAQPQQDYVIRLTQHMSIYVLPLIYSADHHFGYCWQGSRFQTR